MPNAPNQPTKATYIAQISSLESSLLADLSDPNPLLPLLALARNESAEVVHKAVWALHRVFIPLISKGSVGGLIHANLEQNVAESVGSGDIEGGESRAVKAWVRERLVEYIRVLGGLLRDREAALRSSAVPLLFSLLPPLSGSLPIQPSLHTPYFRIMLNLFFNPVSSLRGASPRTGAGSSQSAGQWNIVPAHQVQEDEGVLPADVVELVVDDFWAKYDDLRWAFFRETRQILRGQTLAHPDNLLAQLLPLTNLPRLPEDLNAFYITAFTEPPSPSASSSSKKLKISTKPAKSRKGKAELDSMPEWMQTFDSSSSEDESSAGTKRPRDRTSALSTHASMHSVQSHVSQYTDLWLTVLSGASVYLDDVWTRKILVGLHGNSGILGHMNAAKRVRITDWLGGLVDRGGALGMLAMNGLFVLMTTYNLDYPNFYPRLYTLLTPSLLHSKYRARFFRLLDTFLRSTLLSSALVASFIKRLSRLALTAPPAGVIIVVPFVYNLFKRHKGCMVMLQRWDADVEDPYDETDPSPFTSNAINSSAYELASLTKHYLSSASTMSGIFKEVFTKPEFSMEDFLDHGYATLFETELNRRIKNAPALSMTLEAPMLGAGAGVGAGKLELFPRPKEAGMGNGDEEEQNVLDSNDVVADLWAF